MRTRKKSQGIDDLFKPVSDQQDAYVGEPRSSLQTSQLSAFVLDAPEALRDGASAQPFSSADPDLSESGGDGKRVNSGSMPQSKSTRSGTSQKAQRRGPSAIDASLRSEPRAIVGHATAERYISVRQVASRYGVGISTIWRWAAEDDIFPQPLQLSAGITRWLESELRSFEALRRTRK